MFCTPIASAQQLFATQRHYGVCPPIALRLRHYVSLRRQSPTTQPNHRLHNKILQTTHGRIRRTALARCSPRNLNFLDKRTGIQNFIIPNSSFLINNGTSNNIRHRTNRATITTICHTCYRRNDSFIAIQHD